MRRNHSLSLLASLLALPALAACPDSSAEPDARSRFDAGPEVFDAGPEVFDAGPEVFDAALPDAALPDAAPLAASGPLALLHFNGANGSTTYVDEYGNTWVTSDSSGSSSFTPAYSTIRSKFGSSSLQSLWGTTAGKIVTSIPNIDYNSDFSLDFWYWHDAAGGGLSSYGRTLFTIAYDGGTYVLHKQNPGASPLALESIDYGTQYSAADMIDDEWVHYRFVRTGAVSRLCVNGSVAITTTGAGPIVGSGSLIITMGSSFPSCEGYLDEVYFTTEALPTTFTVPIGEWI